ncbi:MAG: hypothetical protein NW214_16100 [Pseudanabaenaceae cyanobacterium bins.39]|nr:hypothetical protein [Pseudanabaenaceae cyanobacterium bins.39]
MKRLKYLGLSIFALFSFAPLPVLAEPSRLEFKVFPRYTDSPNPFADCPTSFSLVETPRPYTEGSYTIDGTASLGWLAKGFRIASVDEFSVTWVAQLQPKYRKCVGTAKISKVNGEMFEYHSHLLMRFMKGSAYLTLDMTGKQDANDLTAVIMNQNVKNGNPVWTWGGTD